MLNLDKLVRPNILKLTPYSSARDEFSGKEGVFLDANENPFGNNNRYPDPYQKEIKSILSNRYAINNDAIFVGNGSDEVIELLFRIFCIPGKDKALTFTPSYGMYQVSADINNVELYYEALDNNFNIQLDSLFPKLTDDKLKVIFICSPNNPTGNCVPQKTIEKILQNFDGIVCVDEAYIDFSPEKTALSLISKYPNLVVSRTMSKAWGLAGARIGFAFAQPEIIKLFNKVKPPYNVSQLNQEAAVKTLTDTITFENNLQLIKSERTKLIEAFKNLSIIKKIYPTEANFILIEVDDANKRYQELSGQNIIIRNRNKQIQNCLRVTVGSPEENQLLLKALTTINNEKSIIYR